MDHADESPLEENPSNFTNAIAVICAVAAAGTLAYAMFGQGPIPDVSDADFALKSPAIDRDRLKAEREAAYGDVDLSGAQDEVDELLKVTRDANRLQFGEPTMKELRDTKILTEHHANAVITETGIDAFMAAGKPLFDNCMAGVQAVLADVESGKLEPDEALGDPGESYTDYREWCGKALPALARFGLVSPDGKWNDPKVGPVIFDVMNRYRWAAVLDLRKPPAEQLTPYEFELLTQWRVGRTDVPIDRRIDWVQTAARRLDDFDVYETVGNMYFHDNNYEAAYLAYAQRCEKNKADPFLQRKCAYLKRKASSANMSGPVTDEGT